MLFIILVGRSLQKRFLLRYKVVGVCVCVGIFIAPGANGNCCCRTNDERNVGGCRESERGDGIVERRRQKPTNSTISPRRSGTHAAMKERERGENDLLKLATAVVVYRKETIRVIPQNKH